MRVAIIGAGKMGVWFAQFFRGEGYSVVIASRNKKKLARIGKELDFEIASFEQAIKKADKILICVSLDAFEKVAKTISPEIKKGQIIIDICSIKEYPVDVMHKYFGKNLTLGMHPVFGPGSTSLKNKTIILTPTNSKETKFAESFKKWLEQKDVHVFIMAPKKHDRLMSVVLGFPHFIGLVACDVLLDQKNYSETKNVAGTTFRMLFTLAEVAALETPELFNSLQSNLPEIAELENMFIEKASEWLELIKKKDSIAITAKMKQLKSKLKRKNANYESSYKAMYKMLESSET
ncbi:MAG TPA: prephenate dehydrogenase/arogenate dehydrogenase family protein [Candidatus Glassbacteria bacterium]|nr:prephenate dehydrogenase/arogenate dehydrogenase family protein [Candidatus Glassbacteria bacterium]